MSSTRSEQPCGCWHAITTRQVPKLRPVAVYEDDGITVKFPAGSPFLDENGAFITEESEELEDGFCETHSSELASRQQALAKALASGASPDLAMTGFLNGATAEELLALPPVNTLALGEGAGDAVGSKWQFCRWVDSNGVKCGEPATTDHPDGRCGKHLHGDLPQDDGTYLSADDIAKIE